MRKLYCLLTVGAILIAPFTCNAWLTIFSDTFDSDHVYWDGTTENIAGGWQGIMFEGTASNINANITTAGCLTVCINAGIDSRAEDAAYDMPLLYIIVTNNMDFRVIVKAAEPVPNQAYDNTGTMVANPDESVNHVETYAFPYAASWANKNVLRTTENGSSLSQNDEHPYLPWMKLVRQGNDFHAYGKALEADPWIPIATNTVTFLPQVLRVGLYAANYNTVNPATLYSFESFQVDLVPEPAGLLLFLVLPAVRFMSRS